MKKLYLLTFFLLFNLVSSGLNAGGKPSKPKKTNNCLSSYERQDPQAAIDTCNVLEEACNERLDSCTKRNESSLSEIKKVEEEMELPAENLRSCQDSLRNCYDQKNTLTYEENNLKKEIKKLNDENKTICSEDEKCNNSLSLYQKQNLQTEKMIKEYDGKLKICQKETDSCLSEEKILISNTNDVENNIPNLVTRHEECIESLTLCLAYEKNALSLLLVKRNQNEIQKQNLKNCLEERDNIPQCKSYDGFNIEEVKGENEKLKIENENLDKDWEAEEKELSAELARLTEEVENIPEDYNSVCGEGTSLRLIDGKSYCVD